MLCTLLAFGLQEVLHATAVREGAGLQEDERFGLGPPSDIAVRACSYGEAVNGDYVSLIAVTKTKLSTHSLFARSIRTYD